MRALRDDSSTNTDNDINIKFDNANGDFDKLNHLELSILDAKYKHLENGVGREDLYQVVSYMHTMSNPNEKVLNGGFVYPTDKTGGCLRALRDDVAQPPKYNLSGLGGNVSVIGFKVPKNAASFEDFCKGMKTSEKKLSF